MQGLTEQGGQIKPKSMMPAHTLRTFRRRYAHTLVAVIVPAMMAGMGAGMVLSDGKRNVQSIHDLPQRVAMLRYAQSKTPVLPDMVRTDTSNVRTSALHTPISDLGNITR